MSKDIEFKATLQLLVPLITKELMNQLNISQEEAFTLLYSSKLYNRLEVEETKLWHLSPKTLVSLLNEEIKTGGKIIFPSEA